MSCKCNYFACMHLTRFLFSYRLLTKYPIFLRVGHLSGEAEK